MVGISVCGSMTKRIRSINFSFSFSENVKFVLRILVILAVVIICFFDFVLLMMVQTTPDNWNIAGNLVANILHFFHLM